MSPLKTIIVFFTMFFILENAYAQLTPAQVMKTFFKAAQKKDIGLAKSVTHSRYHEFLDGMANATLAEGVDTTDRRDYQSAQFREVGDGGIVKYKENGADQLFYLAKEDGEWKADPMGMVADLKAGILLITIFPEELPEGTPYTLTVLYEIGGFQTETTINKKLNPGQLYSQQYMAEKVKKVVLDVSDKTAKVKVSAEIATNRKEPHVTQQVFPETYLVNGRFEFSN